MGKPAVIMDVATVRQTFQEQRGGQNNTRTSPKTGTGDIKLPGKGNVLHNPQKIVSFPQFGKIVFFLQFGIRVMRAGLLSGSHPAERRIIVQEKDMEEEIMEMTDADWENQRLLGAKFRKRREALGMTLAEMAAKMGPGYSEELVSQYEAGSVAMHIGPFFSMLAALHIDPDDINPNYLRAEHLAHTGYLRLNEKSRSTVDQLIARMLDEQQSGI